MAAEDLKTLGVVLRRTNYGEADRILSIITPAGKVAAIAKGVRKARSKLAGGVEMFCLSELQIHRGRSELGVVTSARMVRHYKGILQSYERMEAAAEILKRVSAAAEQTESAEWFEMTRQGLEALDGGADLRLVEGWFWLHFLRANGEEVNLYRDNKGEKLVADGRYNWDGAEGVFVKNADGEYGADEIKVLRLMATADLPIVRRVKIDEKIFDKIYGIIKRWEN